jgi:uncharacterized protein
VPPTPVSDKERIESLDVLRGFALLGILAMNIRAMAAPFGAYMTPAAFFPYEGASRAAYIFTSVVFDLKMMGLFSMLFGAGVLLYAQKRTEGSEPPRALWFRRMFWLLVIGLVHAYLIWEGDILVPYALCGILVLWWARRWSARTLTVAAIVFLAIGAAGLVAQGVMWNSMPEAQRAEQLALLSPSPQQAEEQLVIMRGAYWPIVADRAPFVFMTQTMFFLMFFLWRCGGMMLLGMALYKAGFLEGRWSARTYTGMAIVCLALGWSLAAFGVSELERVRFAMPQRSTADVWNYVGAVFASIGYAASLLLLVKHDAIAGLRRRLAAVGQMAFTNYLTHSIVTAVVFLGWGLGFAGRLHYAEQLLFVAGVWIVQLIVSPLWLAQFRFGPAEWLWRSLTYWERQPMRHAGRGSAKIGGVPAGYS